MDKYAPKHQPATILPWTAQIGEKAGSIVQKGQTKPIVGTIHARDAAYIAHAANAYPELVGLMRVIAGCTKDKGCTKVWMEDYAKLLLKDIGERE